jgi:anti-sigma B factor antagonist
VPLYACERCGFTSAAFRPEAVSAHRLQDPDCDGVMRIVFRSDDRYRGEISPPQMAPRLIEPIREEAQPLPAASGTAFEMRERREVDGTLCLSLVGDLDLTVAESFSARLEELKAAGRPVRLDLSQVTFIDSSGLQSLILALTDARWTRWQLEVAPEVSPSVERAAQIVGIAQVLWPQGRLGTRSVAPHSETPHELA